MEEREWGEYERRVVETVKWCEDRKGSPLVWAMEVGKLASRVPSPELAQVLVSHLCFLHNRPSLWKFLEQSLSSGLLFPLQVLSLLSSRVIANRWSQPEAYNLYLELLSRYGLSFTPLPPHASIEKIIRSVDHALQLSQTYDVPTLELGHVFVLFFFSIVVGLIDSILDDWGVQKSSLDVSSLAFVSTDHDDMDIDSTESHNLGRKEHRGEMRSRNSLKALEVLGKLLEGRKAVLLLRLVHFNMPEKFNGLLHRLELLKAHRLASSDLKPAIQLLERFSANIQRVFDYELRLDKRQLTGTLVVNESFKTVSLGNFKSCHSACWISLDIYLEHIIDGRHLPIKSAINVISEACVTLQTINRTTWQETFLALWLSALRLVQREREPLEGPVPHLEARLCVLLSIVPLAIAKVLEDEAQMLSSSHPATMMSGYETGYGQGMSGKTLLPRKQGLVSSLQVLGQFSALLCPPPSVVAAANIALSKAARFVHSSRNEKERVDYGSHGQGFTKSGGNMRHLIVEACIARSLVDTSAYFWPGYVPASAISSSDTAPIQKSPWSTFLEGAPLSGSLINALVTTPASSLAETEKMYQIALHGSEEEKTAAAKILCGASLRSGWNIQEHVVRYVVKLLSPPVPPNYNGERSHLVDCMPMLSAILYGASSVDTVHILTLHGVVPEVAAYLMPPCEVFGSLEPTLSTKSNKADDPSVYMVFSLAFLFLLRLWKFYRPPLEQCMTEHARAVGGELSLEYLLSLHNNRTVFFQNETTSNPDHIENVSDNATYVHSYPKLRSWYWQNRSCIVSTPSVLSSESPIHQLANKILNMICLKMTKSGSTLGNSSTTSSSGSSTSAGEDAFQRPIQVPAWEVLEAIPFVLEAILTACAHGKLSSRDLTTGLRDLVEFLPASLAAIISYFSAETTRGVWKSVLMNGIDWPSPAAILPSVQSEIKEILAATGVSIPNYPSDVSQIMLPLPMAALVSLTITFKLEKNLEYIHGVAGPGLESCASNGPWPAIPAVGSLWAQKVRRWHYFIVFSCCRSVFRQNKECVDQLLRSCFTAFLGSVPVLTPSLSCQSGVDGLLGSTIADRNVHPIVAPGFLYLHSCRLIQDVLYINDTIVRLVAEFARSSALRWEITDNPRLKSSQASLCLATVKAREVGTLGASLICVAGGFRLVRELYMETIPTWLLSGKETKHGEVSAVSHVVEGYALAYLLILSGSFMWSLGDKLPSWVLTKRVRIIGNHVDFLAGVLEGKIALACHPATWKAYVSCLVGLMVNFAPAWIQEVKLKTLRTLASGLRGWHECELALALLERGGVAAIGSAAELINVIS